MGNVKKHDTVKVLSGRERGKTGRVLEVLVEKERARVEGLMTYKRHLKRGRNPSAPEGGIIERFGTIHLSNLSVVCPKCSEPTRGARKEVDGKKIRVCRNCGANLDEKAKA